MNRDDGVRFSGRWAVHSTCAVTSQAAPGMVTPPGDAYAPGGPGPVWSARRLVLG